MPVPATPPRRSHPKAKGAPRPVDTFAFHPSTPTREDYASSVHDQQRIPYGDSSSIDWNYEAQKERVRIQSLAELSGVRGAATRTWDSAIPWLVVVATGIATGVLASAMDIVTAWLSDLRFGICRDQWWMSRASCCTGLDPGEICNAWRTWGTIAGDSGHVVLRSITQYSVYMFCAVIFASTSSFFVQVYAPFAFHTGIPEIKTILGGYIITDFLSGPTLLIKSLGLPLAVASGLSLGKEGPLVHVACCIGNLILQPFAILRGNEARQREIIASAASAGISVAFGAPLGGVLFSLEEISTYFPGSALWQAFVCAIVAAVTLQYIDPFSTGSLALFEVTTTSQAWRGFELIPWISLGVLGGLWGTLFIKMNVGWEKFRRSSGLGDWPVSEVAVLALFTAVVSYLMLFTRIPSSELTESLFRDCSANDPYRLCDLDNANTTIFLLLVTASVKSILTAITFGSSIPAGIFMPSMTIGACVGRAMGEMMAAAQRAHPTAWIFSSCPADGACIYPSVYAVIGAAGFLGGVTRMTISLVVILFELTGAVNLVLQIMMAVMVSKFTGDFFSQNGIYETWINIREYPFLNNKQKYRRDSVLAKHIMTKAEHIIYLSEGWTIEHIETILETEEYRGFPLVRSIADRIVVGYISRNELQSVIAQARESADVKSSTPCYFTDSNIRGRQVGPRPSSRFEADSKVPSTPTTPSRSEAALSESYNIGSGSATPEDAGWVNLRPWVDQTTMMLSQDTPTEIVLQLCQDLGLRSVLLTRRGALVGILTKMDLHSHVQPDKEVVAPEARRASKSNVGNLGLRSRLGKLSGRSQRPAAIAREIRESEEGSALLSRRDWGS